MRTLRKQHEGPFQWHLAEVRLWEADLRQPHQWRQQEQQPEVAGRRQHPTRGNVRFPIIQMILLQK